MASDVYLQIEGVKGESTDDKHKDWIELVGVDWGRAAALQRHSFDQRRPHHRPCRV